MLYIVDLQRFVINPMGGGKCIESHKVIKTVEYKDKEKVWEKEEPSPWSYIAYVIYSIEVVYCE